MAVSKFTSITRGALIERTAAGASLPDACRSLGLREVTVKSWITRGRRALSGEYFDFVRDIDAARMTVRERPTSLEPADFRRYLEAAVRAGSVAAMKLWASLYIEKSKEVVTDDDHDLDELDELARRRA